MATILFIHGTGVRRAGHEKTLQRIKEGIQKIGLTAMKVEGCLWGDPFGTRLGDALSIPRYLESKGKPQSDEDIGVELWMNLYADPLYELRVLSLQSADRKGVRPGQLPPGEQLDRFVTTLNPSSDLAAKLREAEILGVFEAARTAIVKATAYREMLGAVSDPMGVFQDAVARAIVAQAIRLASADEDEAWLRPNVYADATMRDEVVKLVRDHLGPYQAFPGEWIVKKLLGAGRAAATWGVATAGTPLMKWRRGKVMDGASPLCGDILLYQSRGQKICDLIEKRIREVEPPVVLIAHSLGGVACIDLLIGRQLNALVPLIVTVGSQAPYFYEINALRSLEYSSSPALPPDFPKWVNIYDLRDFLSFVGADIFRGRVADYRVDNRQPFPECHSAYFWNSAFYTILSSAVKVTP